MRDAPDKWWENGEIRYNNVIIEVYNKVPHRIQMSHRWMSVNYDSPSSGQLTKCYPERYFPENHHGWLGVV